MSAVKRGLLPFCTVPKTRRIPFIISLTTRWCAFAGEFANPDALCLSVIEQSRRVIVATA
jgi:hypothetical protein